MIMQQQSAMNMNMMNHHHHHHPSPAAKTALIMSRYRPIAPKPDSSSSSSSSPLLTNPIFQQQPRTAYLKNLWPHPHHLQARPTSRIRRKNPTTTTTTTTTAAGLSLSSLPLTFKRRIKPSLTASVTDFLTLTQWPVIKPLPPPPPPAAIVTATESLVTLPLLIDLNVTATTADELPSRATSMVISPQPIRPVGSSIRVKLINRDESSSSRSTLGNSKNAEEVEEEVESESLPAVISDSSNRVRLANSAYKEMVGQPVCPWLDVSDGNRPCRRISGEVKIRFSDGDVNEEAVQRTGFSCWVNIEWGNNEEEKKSVHVFCDVIKLVCDTKNYLFAWRFHTRGQAHAPVSAPAPEEGTCKTSMSSSSTTSTTTT